MGQYKLWLGSALALLLSSSCNCGADPLRTLFPIGSVQPSLDFGPRFVGATAQQTVAIASQGTEALHVTGATVEGAGFSIVDDSPAEVAVGDSHLFTVVFAPAGVGAASGTLRIETDAENGPTFSVDLRGEGAAPLTCPADEPCKRYSFDPDTGVCLEEILESACDDGSQCTTNDHCDVGVCVGEAAVCPTLAECGRGVCDNDLGCFAIPDADLCDDAEPCTVESCDANGSCSHLTLGDGETCGHFDSCHVGTCVAAVCVALQRPDGSSCDDDLLCTFDDECDQGVCVGVRSVTTPAPTVVATTFGFGEAFLMPDPEVQPNDVTFFSGRVHAVRALGGVWSELETVPGPLMATATMAVLEAPFGAVAAAFGPPVLVTTYGVNSALFTPLGNVPLIGELNGVLLATAGGRAFAIGDRLHSIDISNPAAPSETATLNDDHIAFALLAVGDRLFYAHLEGLTVFDTSDGDLTVVASDTLGPACSLALGDAGVLALRTDTPNRFVGDRVDVLDPLSAVVTASFDVAGRTVTALAAHHDRAALFGDDLELVALPGGAVLDRVAMHPLSGGGSPQMSASLLVNRTSLGMLGGPSLAFDISADLLTPVTSPAHGVIGALTRVGSGAVAATTNYSARLLDVGNPVAGPTFLAGGTNLLQASLYQLGDGRLLTAPLGIGDATFSYGPLGIVDLSDFDQPALGSARGLAATVNSRFLFPVGDIVVALSARQPGYACDVDCSAPNGRVVAETFDVSTSPPFPYPRLGSAVLPWDSIAGLDEGTLGVDRRAGKMAGVLVAQANLLVVVDASDPSAPIIYPPVATENFVEKTAVRGDRLYAVEATGFEVFDLSSGSTTRIALAQWIDYGMTDGFSVPLAVDDETLVIGRPGRVVFFGVNTLPPRLLGAVTVPITPLYAAADDDRLVVAGLSEALIMTPACPPP